MIHVKLSTNFPEWPLIRQTPDRSGVWGDCRFFINEDIDECDFWVVYDDVLRPETTRCPPGNTLLITGEPPSVKRYHPRYTAQFGHVLTCQRELKHSHVIYRQQALPWMIGCRYIREQGQWDKSYAKDYTELSAMPDVPKTRRLSVLSSDKSFTPGHQRRLSFVEALKARFGDEIDVFGRGIREVEDKWEAIAPYQYHIVIENGEFPDYWTEKLSDALLAGAYPLYAGCPNIGEYFAKDTLTALDISDPEAALRAIDSAMESCCFDATAQARASAKKLLLDRYNLFPTLEGLVGELSQPRIPRKITIQPSKRFALNSKQAIKQAVKNTIKHIIKPGYGKPT